LKTLEKTNRKGNRNSRKIEKAISAQVGPFSLAPSRTRASLVSNRRAPPIGASLSAPSLSLPRGPELSAPFSPPPPRPLSLSLSLCPTVPTCQSSLTSRPRSPHRGRAHDRAFSSHVRATRPARPPPLSHLHPVPSSLALSLALPTRTGSSATIRRRPPPVPWPPLRSCPVQCHGELHVTVSCSGHPSVCPLPPCCVWSALTGAFSCAARVRHGRPVNPLRLRYYFVMSALLLEVSNLPVPLIWLSPLYSSRDCSPEQSSATVSPPRRSLRSLVPPRWCEGHGRVRQASSRASSAPPWTTCSSPANSRRGTERRHRAQASPGR
jgi:hypothetical protein